ncbi:MAG: hypothetical protein COU35_01595 [Candidatus Magasanikbacteria bacterium CG10_big_fil_rev_8_21_14_0_10_47_10]|uniref:Uncharacterized protein n=1 Tax=Candidatus Magasanikbacteria bacterium CG10_big_fil_rev_8_21_14_0_10_47_10 TaxID=1974652 RepID=A0A2H0TR19_9BACT|nr:MAG: hypothetical protein COU35_01595 [Candidatus Magasanikbacteria bacterium CG10_big_fil_rev_8_21_14_0_10_47_10]
MEIMEGSIVLYTPEVEERWLNEMSPLKKGCGIEIAVVYKKMNFDEIKKEIKQIHAGLGIKSEEFEEITINNRQALKNTFDSIVIGPGIVVYFPSKDKLYSVSINWGPDEKENCLQEFNKFLETILIK